MCNKRALKDELAGEEQCGGECGINNGKTKYRHHRDINGWSQDFEGSL